MAFILYTNSPKVFALLKYNIEKANIALKP